MLPICTCSNGVDRFVTTSETYISVEEIKKRNKVKMQESAHS